MSRKVLESGHHRGVVSVGMQQSQGRQRQRAVNRALTLTPLALLHANTDYTAVMTGFEDLAGHAIPDRTWTFRTSGAIDLQAPSILRIDPAGDAVSPNALVSVTFSEP